MARAGHRFLERRTRAWQALALAMEAPLVLKRDLTAPLPLAGKKKGTVTKHVGQGGVQQRNAPAARGTLTAGGTPPLARALNAYPKAPPTPPPAAPAAPPMGPPMGPPDLGG